MAMQMAVALLALSVLASSVAAQSPNPPSCASKLVPCGPYMNGTGPPPETCCGPLKDAVKNELPCLCALYASPEIFKAFNINISDALNLSKRCGVTDTTTACAGIVGSPAKSPPGSPSGGGSGSGKNAGHCTLSVSVPGLMSLFLALWAVLA
uniref:LTP VAS n=1 Tax=Eleusine coracana subsp. coracana TaxID=191504 RepID=A0A6G8MV15_ELECO|nr:LTP VAS [Eleusine coracana subsp. coracana]